MGLSKGIIQVTGTFGGLSFYQGRNGSIYVRTAGGFKGDAIKTKPNYVRTRENAQEFKEVVAVGVFFRFTIQVYLRPMRIPYGHNRVVQLFHRLKMLDLMNRRGFRTVAQGLQSEEAKDILNGFEFDERHKVAEYFRVSYSLLLSNGLLTLAAFDRKNVYFPKGATSARVHFVIVRIDFSTKTASSLLESSLSFESEEVVPPTTLSVAVPPGTGVLIGLLGISYYQEVSGVAYPLQERGLQIII